MSEEEVDPIVGEFLIESYENLDQLDQDFVTLEEQPTNRDILSGIFRTIHTIKGTSGFLGYSKLEALTHVGENLLSKLRDGELVLVEEMTTALLAMVDSVREILGSIETAGSEPETNYDELAATLSRLLDAEPEQKPRVGDILIEEGKATPEDIAAAVAGQDTGDERPIGQILVGEGVVAQKDVSKALSKQVSSKGQSAADSSIRVDVGLLDKLMNLVGELVLARNQIVQFTSSNAEAELVNASQRLSMITSELQEGVMKTRMQPIGTVWNKLPRVVRDLSVSCHKKINVEMEGKETELDKSLIEAIKDPLTHIVRNAVDHGIETPEVRVAAGKPEEGTMLLHAFHEGGQVNIVISDDGGGIPVEKVKAKALEKGVITPEQAESMADRDVQNLVFNAGFSTAAEVTNISGRGVGMDVVRSNIEKIGGSVEVQSTEGVGSTFKIKIPLTLAIVPALIVSNGGDRFAIPQVNLVELVRLDRGGAVNNIEKVHGTPVYRLRGKLLPLVYLDEVLELGRGSEVEDETDSLNIVVLVADNRQFGLVVSDIHDSQEIVVRPLGKELKEVDVYAGATIMGDGQVALIIDILGMAQRAGMLSTERDRARVDHQDDDSQLEKGDRETLLVFRGPDDSRMAIPLSLVTRLEEFQWSTIERSGTQSVVQYRDEIMPLIEIGDALPERRSTPRSGEGEGAVETVHVVVYSPEGRSVGLVVEEILDIVESSMDVQRPSSRLGVMGSVVLEERVTELLDLPGIVESLNLLPEPEPQQSAEA